jgi:hypothetical protein
MPSTRSAQPTPAAALNGLSKAPVLPPPRRRRRPGLLALAVVMVVLGALGAAFLATSLSRMSPVIAIAREVPWGQAITAADLVEAQVPDDPALQPIPYSERDAVIGMVATTTLTPGSLLTFAAVTEQRLPPPGQQLVGVGVSAAQAPLTSLRPGDDVLLVPLTAGAEPSAPAGASTAVEAIVVAAGSPGPDGLRVVDVLVAAADGPDVAARAAAGQLAIVVVSDE